MRETIKVHKTWTLYREDIGPLDMLSSKLSIYHACKIELTVRRVCVELWEGGTSEFDRDFDSKRL